MMTTKESVKPAAIHVLLTGILRAISIGEYENKGLLL